LRSSSHLPLRVSCQQMENRHPSEEPGELLEAENDRVGLGAEIDEALHFVDSGRRQPREHRLAFVACS
jgi:hypothetical protein